MTANFFRLVVVFLATAIAAFAASPASIGPVGLGLGSFNDWSSGPFANTMLTSRDWILSTNGDWGVTVRYFNTDGTRNPQFDENGYPRYLETGQLLRALMWPYSGRNTDKPSGWPNRTDTGIGVWTVTWTGRGDIRLGDADVFLSGRSTGAETGLLTNGRRVYRFNGPPGFNNLTVNAIDPANPITDIKVWLPDPANTDQSLEGHFWHPSFFNTLSGMNHLRFMDWGHTNASPQKDWGDRRLPSHRHQTGVLNRRAPATGVGGDRTTGIAYEYMVKLANDAQRDMWICVPHMATDDYVTKLARLIRYGSDGAEPYTSPQTNPVYPPLNDNLRVWLEYSNEIWSSGNSFPQGNWAGQQGLAKNTFIGRRTAQIYRLFQNVFGGHQRVVRVAGLFTANSTYNTQMLTELRDHGAGLSPAVEPDVIAPTTYFGNGIQDWALQQAQSTFDTDDAWFLTPNSSGVPSVIDRTHPYWTSPKFAQDQLATFAEWKRRLFSGSAAEGGGPDATGTLGGFDGGLPAQLQTIFGSRKPLVAYEGGPSLYTDYLNNTGITLYIEALNRHPGFAEIYGAQLNAAFSKGLDSHTIFVDVSDWGRNGQWGHLEYMGQPLDEAVKWKAVIETAADLATLRPVHSPLGSVPQFTTPAQLPIARYREPYSQDIVVSGGNYTAGATPRIVEVASLMAPGLAVAPVPGDPFRWRVSGTPQGVGSNHLYLRVSDSDGDPSWRIFSLHIAGGPGVLVESDFSGVFNGASSLPWSKAYAVDSRVTFSGWTVGAPWASSGGTARAGADGRGVRLFSSTNGPEFSVSQADTSQAGSTLASAITDREDWTFTLTPQAGTPLDLRGAELRLQWNRLEYHTARHFAVFTSVGGFSEGQQIYQTSTMPAAATVSEAVFTLPDTTAYQSLTAPVQFRVVFYGSQYAHRAQLLGFRLSAPRMITQPPSDGGFSAWITTQPVSVPFAQQGPLDDPDGDGSANFMEFAIGSSPLVPNAQPALQQHWGEERVMLTYPRAQPYVNYSVETSTTLAADSWTTDGVDQSFAINGGLITAAFVHATATPRRFFRLRVSAGATSASN